MNSEEHGEPGRNRTCDPRIKSALLYQLSYGPTPFNLPQEKHRNMLLPRPLATVRNAVGGTSWNCVLTDFLIDGSPIPCLSEGLQRRK